METARTLSHLRAFEVVREGNALLYNSLSSHWRAMTESLYVFRGAHVGFLGLLPVRQ